MCRRVLTERLSSATAVVQEAVVTLPQGPLAQACARTANLVAYRAASAVVTIDSTVRRGWSSVRSAVLDVQVTRFAPLAAMLVALVVGIPTLWADPGDDDLLHLATLPTASLSQALSDSYVLINPTISRALMDAGALPWWAQDSTRVAFWRPLAALTLWLDYQLWPRSIPLLHAHNVVWYAAACGVAALLYLRFMGRSWSAALACMLFVLHVSHVDAVSLPASRNVLLAAVWGLLAIMLHDRWRRDGWWVGGILGPIALALCLLSAEAGVGVAAYLLAYAVTLDRGNARQRLASLAPYLAVGVLWKLGHTSLGYGAASSSFYVDPLREPWSFLRSLAEQIPLLLFGQWIAPDPAVYAVLSPGAKRVLWLLAAACGAGLVWLLVPSLRRQRVNRFWFVGMMLALVPACAVTLPSGRHLMFVGIGALALLAQVASRAIDHLRSGLAGERLDRARRISALVLLGLHGFAYPAVVPLTRSVFDPLSRAMMDIGPLPSGAVQTIVIVNQPSPGQLMYIPALRQAMGQRMPDHIRSLAPGHTAVTVTRVADNTLRVRPDGGYLLSPQAMTGQRGDWLPVGHPSYAARYGDGIGRSFGSPPALGDTVRLSGLEVEVTACSLEGRPLEAEMRFDHSLDDPTLRWLQWDWDREAYTPFTPPPVGGIARVPGPF